jgi:hypothetical protein
VGAIPKIRSDSYHREHYPGAQVLMYQRAKLFRLCGTGDEMVDIAPWCLWDTRVERVVRAIEERAAQDEPLRTSIPSSKSHGLGFSDAITLNTALAD